MAIAGEPFTEGGKGKNEYGPYTEARYEKTNATPPTVEGQAAMSQGEQRLDETQDRQDEDPEAEKTIDRDYRTLDIAYEGSLTISCPEGADNDSDAGTRPVAWPFRLVVSST